MLSLGTLTSAPGTFGAGFDVVFLAGAG